LPYCIEVVCDCFLLNQVARANIIEILKSARLFKLATCCVHQIIKEEQVKPWSA
jgi:hypothetical protein